MTKFVKFLVLSSFALLFAACAGDTGGGKSVGVAKYQIFDGDYKFNMPADTASITSVAYDNNTYYIVGSVGTDYTATLWIYKNGAFSTVDLQDGANYASVTDVTVDSDGNVFVSGIYKETDSSDVLAYIWENTSGTFETHELASTESYAESVIAGSNAIYVSGSKEVSSNDNARLWTYSNGSFAPSTDLHIAGANFTEATVATELGSDVYITGYQYPSGYNGHKALLWKNDSTGSVDLHSMVAATGNTYGKALTSLNGKLYIGGVDTADTTNANFYKYRSIMWVAKDTNNDDFDVVRLSDTAAANATNVYDIIANGNDIYVGGYDTDASYKPHGVIWKYDGTNVTSTTIVEANRNVYLKKLRIDNGAVRGMGYSQERNNMPG